MIKISIAMATYNGSRFLREQLDSLENQNIRPFELIVVDDGSTDNTVEILNEFRRKSGFTCKIYPNKDRLGCSLNFIKAISLCSGQWIALCDQDDYWFPEKLAKLTEYIRIYANSRIAMICHRSNIGDDNLRLTDFVYPYKNLKKPELIEDVPFYPWWTAPGFVSAINNELMQGSMILERQKNEQANKNLQMRPYKHDRWLSFVAAAFGQVLLVPDVLAIYRRHRNAVTTSFVAMSAGRHRDTATMCRQLVASRSVSKEYANDAREFKALVRMLSQAHTQTQTAYGDEKYRSTSNINRLNRLSRYFEIRSMFYENPGNAFHRLWKLIFLLFPYYCVFARLDRDRLSRVSKELIKDIAMALS